MYHKAFANIVFGIAMAGLTGCAISDAGDDQAEGEESPVRLKPEGGNIPVRLKPGSADIGGTSPATNQPGHVRAAAPRRGCQPVLGHPTPRRSLEYP